LLIVNLLKLYNMTKKTKAVLLIVWPPVVFIAILLLFALSSFIIAASMLYEGTAHAGVFPAVVRMLRLVLGLLGLVTIIGGPISIIYGIYLLAKTEKPSQIK